MLTNDIVCSSEWPTHGVVDDQCSRKRELMCPVLECTNHDGDGRNARALYRCPNVPDRHVAHGSDGDEEHHVDLLLLDSLDPPG